MIGSYANYLVVGHNEFEFVLDFGQLYEGSDKPVMHTRVIATPAYARAMLDTRRTSIEQFDASFGTTPQQEDNIQ